jgi:2-isopropylmalate synthase
MEKLIIFDTTLRDGEQSPGASLNARQKLEIARQLQVLGVDVIEAGFPVSSPGDFAAVKEIARQVKRPVICGLARSMQKDIDVAARAIRPAKRKRIHVFLATSKIHMKYKLKKAKDEILRLAVKWTRYARRFTDDVEFSPEDASRTDRDFLFKVVEAVIDAGAKTVNIPDTVGYAIPEEFGQLIYEIKNTVPNINKAVLSVHCHNDLGLGVANSLAAVENGARQVECTINGLGERAGNASLEEIVMAINTRKDLFSNLKISIATPQIYRTSRMVSKLTGMPVQPNKAIVGQNAFSHEAGIHQDGLLKKRTTYEIIRPQDVGFSETRLVLGKHSGRHALAERLKRLGFVLSKKDFARISGRFKKLADKKKEVFDEDLITIVEDELVSVPVTWRLDYLQISSGNKIIPTATIGLKSKGKTYRQGSSGDGPVDACYKAIDKITGIKGKLTDYSIQAVTRGKDAVGEVKIMVQVGKELVPGRGASTDIIEASAKAYLNAINKLIYPRKSRGIKRKIRGESRL